MKLLIVQIVLFAISKAMFILPLQEDIMPSLPEEKDSKFSSDGDERKLIDFESKRAANTEGSLTDEEEKLRKLQSVDSKKGEVLTTTGSLDFE